MSYRLVAKVELIDISDKVVTKVVIMVAVVIGPDVLEDIALIVVEGKLVLVLAIIVGSIACTEMELQGFSSIGFKADSKK